MTILNRGNTDSAARLVSIEGDPQHAGFKLTRQWERLYAPSVDTLSVAINDCVYYTNPKADYQSYSGVFIQSSLDPVARNDDSIDLRQTLTKVKFATAEADADIVGQLGDPKVAGYELSRAWHYIDPYSLDTLFPVVNAVESVTNPLGNTDSLAGKFVISRVRSVEQPDKTYDIIQDMVKVKTITSDTSLTDPLIDRAKDIIHPFGEGTGVSRDILYRYLNLDPASDTKLMAISDTTLVAKMSGQGDTDYTHVSRKSTLEDNRSLTFWILARRKQRIAWGGRYDTPDHIEDQSPSRDNTIRRKFWYGIDNDCYAGVKARLENNASVDTEFSLLGFTVRDMDDGSDDWTQTSIRYLNDTRTDSKIINTHGIQHNAIQMRHSSFDNYATEPTTPDLDTNFKYETVKVWKDERGLISKRVVTSKPAPSNVVSSGVVDSFTLAGVRNGEEAEISGGAGRVFQRTHDQVPIGSVDSIMRTMDVSSVDSEIVSSLDYTDIGNGAARIDQQRKKFNVNASWYIEDVSTSSNGSLKSASRVWPIVADTKATVLLTGLATDSFLFDSTWYLPGRARRIKHFDGTSTIRQVGIEPASLVSTGGGGGGGGAIWIGNGIDSELAYHYMSEAGFQEEVIVYQKSFKSWADAKAFADAGNQFVTSGGILKLGRVDLQGSGRWLAKRVVRA